MAQVNKTISQLTPLAPGLVAGNDLLLIVDVSESLPANKNKVITTSDLSTIFKGSSGSAATVSVGTVTTGAAGSSVIVTNVGSSSAAILNFTIPKGSDGAGSGTVTNVTGTAPISVVTGTSTPVISLPPATGSVDGYLSHTDWNTFNGKQPAGTYATGSGTCSGTNTGDQTLSGLGGVAMGGLAGGQIIKGGIGVTDALSLIGTSGNGVATVPAFNFNVGNNGSINAITILNNGNVSLGPTSFSAKFNIDNSSGAVGSIMTDLIGISEVYTGTQGSMPYNPAGTLLRLTTNNTSSGKLGALITFNAYNNTSTTGAYFGAAAGDTINGSANLVFGRRNSALVWSETMRIDLNGNVGIGTTTPGGKLDVKGVGTTTGVTLQTKDSNDVVKFQVLDNGNISMTGAITALRETRVTMGANDINLSLGNVFTKTISGATTLTLSNVSSSGVVNEFILDITNGGAYTVTWFSGVKWSGGTAPTLTTSGRDLVDFISHDGGATWSGVVNKDMK